MNSYLHIEWNLGSWTNFWIKKCLGWRTVSRITNTQAGNSGKLRVSARECQLLVNWLSFSLRTFRFTNGLQERIKFVNRDSTVFTIPELQMNTLLRWVYIATEHVLNLLIQFVHLSYLYTYNSARISGWIYMKFYSGEFNYKLSGNFSFD
jgi:hypothetical protein